MSDSCDPMNCPWNSLGWNTGVGNCSLLQGILPTQGLNQGLLHWRWILYQLSHQGSPRRPYIMNYSLWSLLGPGKEHDCKNWLGVPSEQIGATVEQSTCCLNVVQRWAIWSKIPWTSGSQLGRGHYFCFARCVLFTQHSVTLELPVEVSFITPPLSMVAWAQSWPSENDRD